MLKNIKIKIKNFLDFAGKDVIATITLSILAGILWYGVESFFILIIQGFMLSIGLLSNDQIFLPKWYPTSALASLILFLLFGFFRAAGTILKSYTSTKAQTAFVCHQRIKLLDASLKNAHSVSSKEILTNFSEVINQSADVVGNCSHLISILCTCILFFITGLSLAPLEMVIGIFSLIIFLYPLKWVNKKITFYGKSLVHEWESASNFLLRGIKNHFFLSIYNQVDSEISQGRKSLEKYKKHFNNYAIIANVSHSFPMFIGILVVAIITYMSVSFIKTEPIKLTAFFYLFIRLAQSAGEMGRTFSAIKLNLPGFMRLSDFYEKIKSLEKKSPPLTKVISEKQLSIEISNMSFGYNKSQPLLKNINLKLSTPDVLIIKGPSGVGKSTLLSIILGFNLPDEGEVKINSFSTNEWKLDLHKVLAYVGPEPYLIEGTLRENLFYGVSHNSSISDFEIWRALEMVELKELVDNLPRKLEEHITDIAQFSTGQKQRLSLARAIIRKPALVILDEATANLDIETEDKIINNLKNIFSQSCSIVVTHKDSFDKIASNQISL